jgi:hypothetical protein
MTATFPASSWLPPEFDEAPDWSFSLRDLKPETPQRFYLTSQIMKCWRYFDTKNRPKLSADFPDNYEDDIGNAYKSEVEKAKPATIWYVRAWHVEGKRMVCLVIDSFPIMKRIGKELKANTQLMIAGEVEGSPLGVSNFYLEFVRDSAPVTPALTYLCDIHLRPTQSDVLRTAAMLPWYPDNYPHNINPLQPAPEAPAPTGIVQTAPGTNGSAQAQPTSTPPPPPAAPAEVW